MKKYINTISAFQYYQLVRYSTLILIGIVFTKTALTRAEIGEYETFVFIAGAVTFFWLNGLLQAFLPLSAEKSTTGSNIFSAFVLLQGYSVFSALFLYSLQPWFSDYLLNGKQLPETGLLLFFIILSGPASLVEYYYLVLKKEKMIFVYGTVSFSVQFLLIVLPVILGFAVRQALTGLVVSSLLRYAWLWIEMIRNKELHFSPTFIREHLIFGGPLVVAGLLSGSAQFVDGFIVTSRFSEETFAVFRYGARELPLAMLLANALSSAMLPAFANDAKRSENLNQLKSNVRRLMHLLFPLTAVLLLISKPLFPVVFNSAFTESATIFNIYLLLIISRLLLPQTILNGLRISGPIMRASFVELILNVALSLLFVQLWGLPGIAFATVVAYIVEKIYLAVVVRKQLQIRFSEYVPQGLYALYSIGIIGFFIFAELIF